MRNEYLEDTRYAQYLIEMTAEEEKLKGFTEALIGVHEGTSIDNLMAIREGVGDKINSVWEKFKGFLERIWAKFMNYANKAILNQVEYLEQYKDIILNRKPNDFAFEMTDYPAGIQRMGSVTIPVFKTVIDKVTTEPTDTSFMHTIIGEYDDKTPWPTFCAQFFEGGTVQKPANLQNMNMTDLYNYCHDFKSRILSNIEKDQKTLQGTLDSIRGDITSASQAAAKPAAPAPEAKKPEDTGNSAPTNNTPPTSQNSSFIDDTYKHFFTEAMTIGKPDDNKDNGTAKAPTSTQTAGNSAVTNQSSTKLGSTTGTNTGVSSLKTTTDAKGADTSAQVDTKGQDSEQLKTLEEKLKNYDTVAAGVLTGKLQAAQNIFNDYMKLIKIHIQQQTGKGGTNQAAANGTNTNQALDLSGLGDLAGFSAEADKIAKNEPPYNDAQKKAETIKQYIDKVKNNNPNFTGNFNDIMKAASSQAAAQQKKPEGK